MKPRRPARQVKMPTVVSAAPTMVTNMTGFLIIRRGSSFLNESPIAGPAIFQSKREGALCVMKSCMVKTVFPARMRKCSTIGPSASAGRKFSAPTSRTVPSSSMTNVPPETGNVPALGGAIFFCASEPASAMIGMIIRKRPIKHRQAERGVVPGRVGGQAGEGAAVVAGAGAEGVKNFAQAVRAGVVQARPGPTC